MGLPRWWFLVVFAAIVLGAIVDTIAPNNLQVLVYKALLLNVALATSVIVDRLFFKPEDKAKASAPVARAIVFCAIVFGLTLGV